MLLEAVYEPHYAHYGDLFGSVIAGFFSDEPQFHNWLVGGHLHDDGLYTYSVGQEGLALPYSDALAAPDRMPDFAGKARYAFAADFTADDLALDWTLDLGRAGQTARLFVNDADAGIRVAPPYRFSLRGRLVAGRNEFVVETASTLARKVKDDLSFFLPIPPEGLLGPIRLQS